MSTLNVVDSSGWLEYFANTKRASLFAPAVEDIANLIVPTISIYEVFKKVFRERGENLALQAASMMQIARVVDLDISLAMEAGHFSLPMADSIIYATAMHHGAILWTQDEDFKNLAAVRFFPR